MTSNIDPTQPPTGYATTAGQRANWQTAHDEITALQSGAAQPSNALPAMDGTAIGGASVLYARGDHVHPTDTSLAPIASPTFTGTVTLPGDPTIPLGAVTKQYSDTKLPIAGGTLIGALTVPSPLSVQGNPATIKVGTSGSGLIIQNYLGNLSLFSTDSSGNTSINGRFQINSSTMGPTWSAGTGAPSGTQPVGSIYSRTDGTAAAGNELYVSDGAGAWQSVATAAAIASNANNAGRNLLHNSRFTIQQRGQGPWTAAGYTADRWVMALTNDTASTSIVALVDADKTAIGDETASFALQCAFTGSSTAGSVTQINQRCENVRRTSNRTVVLSFWARSTTGPLSMLCQLLQSFGTGGSPSTGVYNALGGTLALTANWARFSVSGPISSVVGKTFGTNVGTDFSSVLLYLSLGSSGSLPTQSGTIQIWGAQLELAPPGVSNPQSTQLERIDPRIDLANCQRFYAPIPGIVFSGWGSGLGYQSVFAPVQMRATPTVNISNAIYSNASGMAPSGGNSLVVSQLHANFTAIGYAGCDVIASADL